MLYAWLIQGMADYEEAFAFFYEIAVSNNGGNFSDVQSMFVFDETCQKLDNTTVIHDTVRLCVNVVCTHD